jgi:pyridoxamine 5'-phosphate oxidase
MGFQPDEQLDIGRSIGPATNPIELFGQWMTDAKNTPTIREPLAMAVTTTGENNVLHTRMVLCKHWDAAGFVFYSNYTSQKGLDLQHHSQVASVFYWDPLARQVQISGSVTKTSREDSERYWASRPRESQLSQYISKQSQTLDSRDSLETAWHEADQKFKNSPIPCPPHWGGYCIDPQRIEFWVGRTGRLHDRFLFEKSQTHWTFRRLYP